MATMISLSRGRHAIIDADDNESVSRFKWHITTRGYVACFVSLGRIGGKQIRGYMYLHRLIMRPPNGMEVDHKDGNKQDCRRSNLRVCTHAQNVRNQPGRLGKSRYKGAYWNEQLQRWRSQIKFNYRAIALGYFDTELEAACAYDAAARIHFGEYAKTNFEVNE